MKNMFLKEMFIIIISSMIINDCISCPTQIDIELDSDRYTLPVWGLEYAFINANVINGVPVKWNGSGFAWAWNTNGLNGPLSQNQFDSTFKVYPPSYPGTFNISVQAWDENNYSDSDSAQVDIYELLAQDIYSNYINYRYIACNNDDDNNNGIPDGEEDGPVENEDDLIYVHFYTNPSPLTGSLFLYIPYYQQTGFRFWLDAEKTTEIYPENSDPYYYYRSICFGRFPSALYIERTGDCALMDPCPLQFGYCDHFGVYYYLLYLYPIQAKIDSTTPSYVAYGNGMQINYSVYVTNDQHTFAGTPNSVKLYIKNGDTVIRQIDDLDCVAGNYTQNYLWNGKDGPDLSGDYLNPGQYTLELKLVKNEIVHSAKKDATIIKVDLDVDADRDGDIDNDDEQYEENLITNIKSAYVNRNNDSDNPTAAEDLTVNSGAPIEAEDDLKQIKIKLEPGNLVDLGKGYIILEHLGDNKITIWKNSKKGDGNLILGSGQKIWDLTNSSDIDELNELITSEGFYVLYVEGCELGDCTISAYFKEYPLGPHISEDTIKITVCPGPPIKYPNWNTMSLNMAGGQLHNQWKHFSQTSPPDKYHVYIVKNESSTNPFANGVSGVNPIPILKTGTYPYLDKGYIVNGSQQIGAFLITFPADSDENKHIWVLIRSCVTTGGTYTYESQNTNAYEVVYDHPANGRSSSSLSNLNFYVRPCDNSFDDMFFTSPGGICSICGQEGSDVSWRVARSPRRADGAEGYYYSDSVTNLDFLKNACEGSTGIFTKNLATFGPWSNYDNNGKFFCLVTNMENYGGYCWMDKDSREPWSNQQNAIYNKSNFSDIIYVDSDAIANQDFTNGTFAHELEHNIHYKAVGTNEDVWIDEACAEYAREIKGYATDYPTNFSPPHYNFHELVTISSPPLITYPIASNLSLNHFALDVYDRFGLCPYHNSFGNDLFTAHYEKVALWMHYLDNNVTHKSSTSLLTFVADQDRGINGINDFSDIPILTNPDGPFVKWTIANCANKYISGTKSDYNYDNSSIWKDFGITPSASWPNTTLYTRTVRDLAADYIKYTYSTVTGSLVIRLYEIDNFNMIVLNVIRLNSTNNYIDVQYTAGNIMLDSSGQPIPRARKYIVPGVFGTDYKTAILVITNLTNPNPKDYGYVESYQIKAQIEALP
jgi:hypothetical protein